MDVENVKSSIYSLHRLIISRESFEAEIPILLRISKPHSDFTDRDSDKILCILKVAFS